jgi:uncharacterized protein with HEPN domain
MPPTPADRLVHILTAIDAIQSMLANKTIDDFSIDLPLRLAVERALEIICEAAHRLPQNIKSEQTSIDWQRMVNFGNLLRHVYHRVDPHVVFEIASRELPPLKAFAERVIREEGEGK